MIQPFEAGTDFYVQACGGIFRAEEVSGRAKLEPFFIPQGSVDSVAVTGSLIVFSTGIGGPNAEVVVAVRR